MGNDFVFQLVLALVAAILAAFGFDCGACEQCGAYGVLQCAFYDGGGMYCLPCYWFYMALAM